MATYYVDYKNGSDNAAGGSGAPWKTPAKALQVVSSGDTVRFRGSKTDATTYYRAAWNASVEGVTWENDAGHTPTWHGGFHVNENDFGLTGTVPGETYAPMIKISAHNVTLRGLRVQHVGGVGFTISDLQGNANVGVENALVTQCESAYTYGAAIVVTTGEKTVFVRGAEISHCTFMGMGLGKFDPDKEEGERGKDAVQGSIQLIHCEDTHFHHNLCAYGHGEGINVGRGSRRSVVEYNVVHTMDHIHIALVRCSDCDVRYNVVYHSKHPWYMGGKSGRGALPGGIRIGDESGTAKMRAYPNSEKQRIYGNLVIGCSTCFSVENGNKFDTQMNRAYVGYNTFIGERAIDELQMAATQFVLDIQDRAVGADHVDSLIENNVFYAQAGAGLARARGVGGVAFRNNAWYSTNGDSVPDAARSGSDVGLDGDGRATVDLNITSPLVRFIDAFPNPSPAATGFNVDNYRLRNNSPAIGRASSRSATNGITPPTVTGDLTGATRTDLDRPNSRFFDIGALEFGGVVADSVTAGFSGEPRSGSAPLNVGFTDESSTTGAAVINSRSWNFGDGESSTQRNPNHTYAAVGTYSVTLTVADTTRGLSNALIRTDYITVGSPPTNSVTANFTAAPRNGPEPLYAAFTDTSTVSGEAVINAWSWNFGDGGASTQRSPNHTYAAAGTYSVTLTVADTARSLSDGETKTDFITVTEAGEIIADFTQSATGGEAPVAIFFTDTSTAGGSAEIDRRVWEFGDGNSIENVASVPYIYSEAGRYTPRLTVYDTARNLSSSKTGDEIVITAPPTNDEPGVVDVVRMLLPGTVGTRTIAFNLRGHAPTLVLLFFTRAAVLNTAADDAFVSIGAVTPTEQWAAVFNSNDAGDLSVTEKFFTTTACIAALDGGALEGLAVRSSIGADRLTIEITDDFNGGYLTAVAFGGAQWSARAAEASLGAAGTTTALNPGFTPEWYFLGGTLARQRATVETNADFILGMADGTEQVGHNWRDVHGQDTTRLRADIGRGSVFRHPSGVGSVYLNHIGAGASIPASSLTPSGGDFNARIGWAALDIAGNTDVYVAHLVAPGTTGVEVYEVGFAPSALLATISNHHSPGAASVGDVPESFSIVAADMGATYSVCVASANGATATNSKTMVSDGIKLIAPDGSTILAGTVEFTETGFEIDWTITPGTPRYFNASVFGGTPSIVGPIPQFEADDTTPEDGVVQFTDLSNPNGSPITAWSWSFGDGHGSAEQHPTHTYSEAGVYHVALTVTNANSRETMVKFAYIHYVIGNHWLLGPYESRPITRTSINRLYGDDPAHPYYGFQEHGLSLDGLELDAQPNAETTEEPAGVGKALVKLDWTNRKIVIVWPDGTTSEFSED